MSRLLRNILEMRRVPAKHHEFEPEPSRSFDPGQFVMLGAEVVAVRDGYLEVKRIDYESGDFEPWTVQSRFCFPFEEFLKGREDKQLHELTEWLKAER